MKYRLLLYGNQIEGEIQNIISFELLIFDKNEIKNNFLRVKLSFLLKINHTLNYSKIIVLK